MPYVLETHVGRLIEARLDVSMTLEETQLFRTRMWLLLGGITGRAVLIGDLRRTEMFETAVAQKLLEMLRHDNPKVQRTAFIVREGGVFPLQLERMIADAALTAARSGKSVPMRRTFRDKVVARDWLTEILNPDESARLAKFISDT